MQARFREFYRDTASWSWNVIMPILFVVVFALIFSSEQSDVYKVAVIDRAQAPQSLETFLATRHIKFIDVEDREDAVRKVQRHQMDMLLIADQSPGYWVNEFSANGYLLEKLLRESLLTGDVVMQREVVSGQDISYADWVLPGILAMNMMFSCLWGVGWVVVRYRKNGMLRRMQATPLTPMEFLTAQVIARLIIIVAVTLFVFLCVGLLIGFTVHGSYLALFLIYFSGAACLTSMGLLVATRIKSEELADGLLNLVSWPMMILSGVWFSMEGTHPFAQTLSLVFPLTHLVDGARQVMIDGADLIAVMPQIGLLMGLTLLFLGVSARLFRWS